MEKINTIFLDVDGTLTDGKVYLDNFDNEMKTFNVKDGLMVAGALRTGIDIIIITGRKSKIVERRAAELGIKELYQDIKDKEGKLQEIMQDKEITFENIAYLGDDLNDFKVMKKAAFAGCPADAAEAVKEIADYISDYNGGNGAVRQILQHLFRKTGQLDKILDRYKD
ncbi:MULTISPECIES: HAD family hydrolase [unclassified Halanaerobium]|uniref:KdsC family phosphatase n=1 Tax=unclassified Halanaerobium TaxID=2641197 RepID=UPI000DF2B4CA|nr:MULTISPECIES: HAD-IIIA family hydrolase [unclassified Halanaerobium]RCW48651.1 3-deoxy-D-manno-octulosonate 8-phosphate phosphatase (KDO 8-P phosphatase) [Halanaerobium sp. MA284_MarDTE_T2]RCW86606.1 3-deoxy-D-manno-octulosonate 8-phosphate phosphatase (KDO 8-P phosphatase) [Halanaerobium sp. DL-01]